MKKKNAFFGRGDPQKGHKQAAAQESAPEVLPSTRARQPTVRYRKEKSKMPKPPCRIAAASIRNEGDALKRYSG